jgi:hypothetical protein
MSGAEEAPPTSNPTPAVVPSPDDSAKEVTERDIDVIGDDDDDSILGVGAANGSLQLDEEKSGSGDPDSMGNVTIDPSFNPNGEEELLYEGDVEAEAPLAKEKDAGASQEEGFMINVHETGMELDMAESLPDSRSKDTTGESGDGSGKHSKKSPLWRSGEGRSGEGGSKQSSSKTTSSSSSKSSESKRSSSNKDVDRFVPVSCVSIPLYLPPTG